VPGTYPRPADISARYRGVLLVLGISLQNQLSNPVVSRGVGRRPEQREAAAFAVDGVLARGERDVPAIAGAAFPDGEADQLQPVEGAVGEVELRVSQLARAPVCLSAGSPLGRRGDQPLTPRN
jgi:hypothetical protein